MVLQFSELGSSSFTGEELACVRAGLAIQKRVMLLVLLPGLEGLVIHGEAPATVVLVSV